LLALALIQAAAVPPCDAAHPEILPCTEPLPIVHSLADAIHLPALDRLGGDAVRATMMPSLGGGAVLYQASRTPDGRIELLAVAFFGHPYSGWRERSRAEAVLTPREYRRLLARVDAALAFEVPDPDSQDICLDGPGLRVERSRGGQTSVAEDWICRDGPASRAFEVVSGFACALVGLEAGPGSNGPNCPARRRERFMD
jgi:hypothetical protein